MTINKTLAAAALAMTAAVATPSAAQADVHIGIGLGGFGPGYYGGPVWGGGGYVPHPNKISCFKGRKIVRWSGFKFVKTKECNGKIYTYRGRKFGNKYRVRVNAYTGNIVSVKPI